MVFRDEDIWSMEARWQDETHRIELDGKLNYQGPLFNARLDTETFEPVQIEVTGRARDGDLLSLDPAATMFVLLNGLMRSLPHLTRALAAGADDTGKIPHPGYAE